MERTLSTRGIPSFLRIGRRLENRARPLAAVGAGLPTRNTRQDPDPTHGGRVMEFGAMAAGLVALFESRWAVSNRERELAWPVRRWRSSFSARPHSTPSMSWPVDIKAHFRFLLSVSLFPFSRLGSTWRKPTTPAKWFLLTLDMVLAAA